MSEIQSHIEEIYHTEISKDLISTIIDGVIDKVTRWQNQALEDTSYNKVKELRSTKYM